MVLDGAVSYIFIATGNQMFIIGVSGHVTLSCNQWRNTAFHLYVVFMQFLKVYSYVKKLFFVIHN